MARWPEWDVSKEIAQLNGPFERGACGWAKQRGNLSGSFTITEIHLLEPVARGLCPGGQEVEVQGGSGPLIRLSAPKMRRDIAESLAALQRLLSR